MGVNTGSMNTSTDTRGSLLRHHTEIIGGLLVAVLLAFAWWLGGPPLAVFLPIDEGSYTGVEPVAAMIPYTLIMAVAVFVALTSVSVVTRSLSWIVLVMTWIADFFSFFMIETSLGWLDSVTAALTAVWTAMPAVVFLLVCWRLPRPRFDTYLAEAILLLLIGIQMGSLTPGYINGSPEPGEVPVAGILLYLGAAAYFGFAAWLVPTRRILYGAATVAGVSIAAFSMVLFGGGWVQNFVVFPILALGIPLIGLLVQIALWLRGKVQATAA